MVSGQWIPPTLQRDSIASISAALTPNCGWAELETEGKWVERREFERV